MTRRISGDHHYFHQVIGGKARKELAKRIRDSSIFIQRAKNGKLRISLKEIDIPYFNFGEASDGVGRGDGEKGDVIGRDPQKGNGAGTEDGEGMLVDVDVNFVLDILQEELELPNIKPKDRTFENTDIKYDDISKTGPESLRDNKRTMKEAIKRGLASGQGQEEIYVPGQVDPVKAIFPINRDKRYRQWKEVNIPSNKAVLLFSRDGSGSMDDEKCTIISHICYWTEQWLRRFYEKVEVAYFWHDIDGEEVNSEKFYKYRYGGGTVCSSVLKLIAEQFQSRFPPQQYNIYTLYFTDGENDDKDNEIFCELIRDKFSFQDVNLFALTQVLCSNYSGSVKKYLENFIWHNKMPNLSMISIGPEINASWENSWALGSMTDEDKNSAVKRVLKHHFGKKES